MRGILSDTDVTIHSDETIPDDFGPATQGDTSDLFLRFVSDSNISFIVQINEDIDTTNNFSTTLDILTNRIINDEDDLTAADRPMQAGPNDDFGQPTDCLLYTSPSPRDRQKSRMPSSA